MVPNLVENCQFSKKKQQIVALGDFGQKVNWYGIVGMV